MLNAANSNTYSADNGTELFFTLHICCYFYHSWWIKMTITTVENRTHALHASEWRHSSRGPLQQAAFQSTQNERHAAATVVQLVCETEKHMTACNTSLSNTRTFQDQDSFLKFTDKMYIHWCQPRSAAHVTGLCRGSTRLLAVSTDQVHQLQQSAGW